MKIIELIENGNQIKVNENNKKEFVKAMVYAKLFKEIENQVNKLIHGIGEIIPIKYLKKLSEHDLAIRLANVSKIDGKINFSMNFVNF